VPASFDLEQPKKMLQHDKSSFLEDALKKSNFQKYSNPKGATKKAN
jgi:hypothetical protein